MSQPLSLDSIQLDELLNCARLAAQAAGDHALRHQCLPDQRILEAGPHDVKLALDKECQDIAAAIIAERYPEHSILGEESDHQQVTASESKLQWIIDPIDGTVNFYHGLYQWCSSVAVAHGTTILAGAVYVPVLKEMFSAHCRGPALLNDRPIEPSQTDSLAASLVLTGLSKHVGQTGERPFDLLRTLALKTRKVRIMGAAALDICHVACGRADAYIESSIYLWDVAAAGLIAQRAGAFTQVMHRFDRFNFFYICCTPRLAEPLQALLRPFVPADQP